MKKRKKKRPCSTDEGSYTCPTCGEQIVIPLDPTGGSDQQYVEDCPVCCNPNVIHLEFFGEDRAGACSGRSGMRSPDHVFGQKAWRGVSHCSGDSARNPPGR